MFKSFLKGFLVLILVAFFCSCSKSEVSTSVEVKDQEVTNQDDAKKEKVISEKKPNSIILATTTSTQDSGLLNFLIPEFVKETEIEVDVISVGTGAAIKMGEDGEADVLLVHSKKSEEDFMRAGNGVERSDVMYNDFILVGPKDETIFRDIKNAFEKIKEDKKIFVSRGDQSGTHKKELEIWGDTPYSGENYIEAGRGMGEVLIMTNEKQGYTLADRATYLAQKENLDLTIICESDEKLLNQYGVITVNPNKNEKINYQGAKVFYDWIIGDKAQGLIKNFGVKEYGESLFFPNAKM